MQNLISQKYFERVLPALNSDYSRHYIKRFLGRSGHGIVVSLTHKPENEFGMIAKKSLCVILSQAYAHI